MIPLVISLALTFPPALDLFADIRLRTHIVRAGETHLFETDGAAVELWDYNFLITDSALQLNMLDDKLSAIRSEAMAYASAEVSKVTLRLRAENDDLRDALELKSRVLFDANAQIGELKARSNMYILGGAIMSGVALGLGIYVLVSR